MAASEEDRRRHPRFACSGEAELRSLGSGRRVVGRFGNLSLDGCLMLLDETRGFRPGEALEMTFCVRQLPVRVQGSVRQVHAGRAVGVEFSMISERGKRQLLELIGELREVLRHRIDDLANATKETQEQDARGAVRHIRN